MAHERFEMSTLIAGGVDYAPHVRLIVLRRGMANSVYVPGIVNLATLSTRKVLHAQDPGCVRPRPPRQWISLHIIKISDIFASASQY